MFHLSSRKLTSICNKFFLTFDIVFLTMMCLKKKNPHQNTKVKSICESAPISLKATYLYTKSFSKKKKQDLVAVFAFRCCK